MRRERDRTGGFSLVEVLATLAIAGAVLAALSSLVSLLVRQTERVARSAETREVAGRSIATVARAIEGTARLRWPGGPRFVFAGDRDGLTFALDSREGTTPRTRIVRIRSVAEADGFALSWSEGPFTPDLRDMAQVAFGPPHRLRTGLPLRFAYAAAGNVSSPEVLTDDWPAADALPEAVRIALVDPDSGEIRSSLRVPLRASAEPGCLAPARAACSRFDARKVPREGARPGAARRENGPEQVPR